METENLEIWIPVQVSLTLKKTNNSLGSHILNRSLIIWVLLVVVYIYLQSESVELNDVWGYFYLKVYDHLLNHK